MEGPTQCFVDPLAMVVGLRLVDGPEFGLKGRKLGSDLVFEGEWGSFMGRPTHRYEFALQENC